MWRTMRARDARGDQGVALPTVMGVTAVLMLFLLGVLGATLTSIGPARADQDSKAALAAAQAGIDEYISRLNITSGGYWEKGNADPTNPAFGAAGTPVPGAQAGGARFRYRLLTTQAQTAQQGFILLEATGTARAGGRQVSRTLTARLNPRGFLDYIYFTDLEALDPELYKNGVTATRDGVTSIDHGGGKRTYFVAHPTQVAAQCSKYYYEGRTSPSYVTGTTDPSGASTTYYEVDTRTGTTTQVSTAGRIIRFACSEIQWAGGDVVTGDFHTNDALKITGPVRFASPVVESGWTTGNPDRLWWGGGQPVGPTASPAGYLPRAAARLELPSGNQELLKHVQPKIDTSPNTDRPGCLYRGATKIVFDGATMKVHSPNTTDAPERCLTVGSRGQIQTKGIPPVIYIAPMSGSCSGVGYPVANEATGYALTYNSGCGRGTAFVSGTVDGQVTVSAEDDIVVTADLRLTDRTSTDVVGLVAGNNVWVYHPVTSGGANVLTPDKAVRNIEASILSLRHSFIVQAYPYGAPLSTVGDEGSKLRVYGAIGQKFRGPVGTGNGSDFTSGYGKNYIYDPRLKVLQPPFFLEPDNAPWEAAQVTDG